MTCKTPSGGEVGACGRRGANTDDLDTVVDVEFAGLCGANRQHLTIEVLGPQHRHNGIETV